MTSPFETVITKMWDLGVFHFLLYMLTAAVFYGLLRKSKLFGEPKQNVIVNGVVALVAALMVWAYPVIVGVDIVKDFIVFFTQGLIAMMVVVIGLLTTSMFLPEGLAKGLKELGLGKKFYGGLLVIILLIVFGILISSGLGNIFFPGGISAPGAGVTISEDIIITIGVLILIIVTVGAIVFVGGR